MSKQDGGGNGFPAFHGLGGKSQGFAVADDGENLYFRVPKDGNFGPSKSGRTLIVAATRGWGCPVGPGLVFTGTVYRSTE
ncbi:MAG: hypothetical protein ACE5I7_19290 [Candidatus Binatia bacterium]